MLKCNLDGFFFLLRALRLPSIVRLCFVIILTLYNPVLSLNLRNIQIRYLHPIIMLCHILLDFLISRLSTLRFGPRCAKVSWTFSASPQLSNPAHPYLVSHSHDVSLRGVWTKGIPSQRAYQVKSYPHKITEIWAIFLQYEYRSFNPFPTKYKYH